MHGPAPLTARQSSPSIFHVPRHVKLHKLDWPGGRRPHHGPAPCRGVSHTIIEELVDSPRSPFHPLGLAEHQKAGGYERAARRQVSQLRRLKQDPGALALDAAPEWPSLFDDPTRPLVVDLGCGAGRCMLLGAAASQALSAPAPPPREAQAAEQAAAARSSSGAGGSGAGGGGGGACGGSGCSGCNFLGVDVRLALTSRANAWAGLLGLSGRAAFLCANANASLPLLLGSYGGGSSSSCGPDDGCSSAASRSSSAGSRSGGGSTGQHEQEGEGRPCAATAAPANARRAVAAGGGRVALVCLQFSDPVSDRGPEAGPHWRREALVGGDELVRQLAEALQPGALVWIQSDVLSTASSFRRLFWRHGGFAPSARHAAATSATHCSEWLGPEEAGAAGAESSAGAAGVAGTSGHGGALADCAGAGAAGKGARRLLELLQRPLLGLSRKPEQESEPGPPLLLTDVPDLATHTEPVLTEQQVAEVCGRHGAAGYHGTSLTSSSASTTSLRRQAGVEPTERMSHSGGGSATEPAGTAAGQGDGAGGEASEGDAEDGWRDLPWLDSNPLGTPTERELYVERGRRPIYRLLLVRR